MSQPNASTRLIAALIGASPLSILLFGGQLTVLCASRAFYAAFGLTAANTEGRLLADVGAGEWSSPQLGLLLENALAGGPDIQAYETDLVRPDLETRRLSVHAESVSHAEDEDGVLVLLTITDLTDVRRIQSVNSSLLEEKDALLRERAILLQEMQHRVANSLQIIASVLMLKARAVKSEETRRHLRDAHDRVLSVAAVQRHLQQGSGDADLAPYLEKLCESLAFSMIPEGRALALEVEAEPDRVSSHTAVSLGLIVTELVINALKHAFPEDRSGRIEVSYDRMPSGWVLAVTDDGVGPDASGPEPRIGLGTTVVEALARQLGAAVTISDAAPGYRVRVVNDGAPGRLAVVAA